MELLVTLFLIALVAVLAFWVVDRIGFPDPLGWILKAIIGFLVLVAILNTGIIGPLPF